MKGGREHRVPLPDAAATLLEGLPWRGTSELLFPSPHTDKPLSDAVELPRLSGQVEAFGGRTEEVPPFEVGR
jgi:integrase